MRKLLMLAVLTTLFAAGCGDDPTGPGDASIDGTWQGSSSGLNVTMTINQSGSSVSGSGNISGPNGSIASTVSGNRSGADLSLTLSAQGYEPSNFTGKIVSATTITGSLTGSGLTDFSITLNKQ